MISRNLLKQIALPLFLVLSQLVFSQGTEVTGKVTDSKDGSPIAGVTVTPKGSRTGTQTNGEGFYSIQSVAFDE